MLRVRSERGDHSDKVAEKLVIPKFFSVKAKVKEVLKHQNIPGLIILGVKLGDFSVLKWLHLSRDLSI